MSLVEHLLLWPGLLLVAISCGLLFNALRKGPQAYTAESRRRVFLRIAAVCAFGTVILLLLVFVE